MVYLSILHANPAVIFFPFSAPFPEEQTRKSDLGCGASARQLNVTKLSGTPPKSGRCQRFREIDMANSPRTRAPKFEAEISANDIFKIVATIIVLLVVGAMAALYLGIMT
jgi:hypothetical protein